MSDIVSIWKELVRDIVIDSTGNHTFSGRRKIVSPALFIVSGSAFDDFNMTLEMFGYADAKIKQLERNYYNVKVLDQLFKNLKQYQERSASEAFLAIEMKNEDKPSDSQGHCMRSLTISMIKKKHGYFISPHLHYRVSEVLRKFPADLIFFNSHILPRIKELGSISQVTFSFASLVFTCNSLPFYFQFFKDPVSYFEFVKDYDPILYKGSVRGIMRFMYKNIKFSSVNKMKQELMRWMNSNPEKAERLKEYIGGAVV